MEERGGFQCRGKEAQLSARLHPEDPVGWASEKENKKQRKVKVSSNKCRETTQQSRKASVRTALGHLTGDQGSVQEQGS